jgi:predicted transcriptional regulator
MSIKEETKLNIVRLAAGNPATTYRQISKQLRVPVSSVSLVAIAAGIRRKRGQHKLDETPVITYLRENPLTCYADVAKRFGVHKMTVQKIAYQHGLARATGRMNHESKATLRGLELLRKYPDMTFREAAKACGVSEVTIGHHAHKAGMVRRRGPFGDPIVDHDLVIRLLKTKPYLTAEQIAEQSGCAPQTVRKIGIQNGIARSNVRAKLIARTLREVIGADYRDVV